MSDFDVSQFKPLYDNVLLEPIKETNRGGIELPVSAQTQTLTKAKVLAVGDGKFDVEGSKFIGMTLRPGDTVYINTFLGMKIRLDPKNELIVQKEEDIRVRVESAK